MNSPGVYILAVYTLLVLLFLLALCGARTKKPTANPFRAVNEGAFPETLPGSSRSCEGVSDLNRPTNLVNN